MTLAQRTVAVGDPWTAPPSEGPTRLTGVAPGRIAIFGQYWPVDRQRIGFAPAAAQGDARDVRYFVEVPRPADGRWPVAASGAEWSGILVKGGLPGTMERLFRALGYRVADDHYTLYISVRSMRLGHYLRALQFGLGAFVFLLFAVLQRRYVRRTRMPPGARSYA
ncbi:MAG: hypothetical protein H0X36_08170 [Sphingomonadaceae bacterium]|nr:hypothetical protein [Sphingomonadaceae bacterium]